MYKSLRLKRDPIEVEEEQSMAKNDEREHFGHVLRELRESAHLTQYEMATMLHLSTKTISRWELRETRTAW
jgi:DNA-binding transcriptional regulator YiaG